jgi:protein tyrosine phosphatase (PTP) superfamily phosphohydrolase (DUF442 family)
MAYTAPDVRQDKIDADQIDVQSYPVQAKQPYILRYCTDGCHTLSIRQMTEPDCQIADKWIDSQEIVR